MAALEARHVDETRGTADERAAGKRKLRHRLVTAFGDGAGAVADALAARKRVADQRMGLEALEFLEWRQIRILVIEMNDEADGNQIIVEVIKERAAAGTVAERPAHRMLDQAAAMLLRRDLPQFLQADAELLRLPVLRQRETLDQNLGQAAARAFGEQSVFAAQFHAAGEACIVVPVLADAHVASGDAGDGTVLEQHFGGGKAGIDLDAERFGLFRQITAYVAERDDEIAVIAHQRRQQEIRQP